MIKYSDLQDLCLSDLKRLQGQVNALIQGKQIVQLKNVGVGDKVRVNHKRARGLYTIVGKNRKTYTLYNEDGERLRASIGLIEPVSA
jgi:hypothetical protein